MFTLFLILVMPTNGQQQPEPFETEEQKIRRQVFECIDVSKDMNRCHTVSILLINIAMLMMIGNRARLFNNVQHENIKEFIIEPIICNTVQHLMSKNC